MQHNRFLNVILGQGNVSNQFSRQASAVDRFALKFRLDGIQPFPPAQDSSFISSSRNIPIVEDNINIASDSKLTEEENPWLADEFTYVSWAF